MATGSFDGEVQGLNQLQAQEEQQFGPGNYMPRVRLMYWSMRVMAMLGVAMFLVAAVGAWLYRKRKLHEARWFQRIAIVAIALPVPRRDGRLDPDRDGPPAVDRAGPAEDRRRRTRRTSAPPRSRRASACSRCSTSTLGVVDFVLMRRYARVDPPRPATATDWARCGRAGIGAGNRSGMTWASRASGSS